MNTMLLRTYLLGFGSFEEESHWPSHLQLRIEIHSYEEEVEHFFEEENQVVLAHNIHISFTKLTNMQSQSWINMTFDIILSDL